MFYVLSTPEDNRALRPEEFQLRPHPRTPPCLSLVARGVYGSDGQVFLINDATITGTVSIAIAEIYAMVHPSTSVQYSILSYSTMSDPNMDSSHSYPRHAHTTVQYISLGMLHTPAHVHRGVICREEASRARALPTSSPE